MKKPEGGPGKLYHGIVLAGTYQWGCSPLERMMPRCLLPVVETPLIFYALRWLQDGGFPRATICANNASKMIRTQLGDGSALGMDIEYYEDLTPRGAAGCLRDAALRKHATTLVVVDGTAIPAVDLEQLMAAHVLSGAAMSVVGHRDPGWETQGYRPLTPAGIYVLERRVLDFIPEKGFQDLKESLIPRLYAAGERVMTYAGVGACPRVINADTYLAVNQWMVERIVKRPVVGDSYRVQGESVAHATAQIDPGASIIGPVLLGPSVVVESGATIVGPTTLGAHSRVSAGALLSRSVTWNRCKIGSGAVVDRCLLGDDIVVPAQAQLMAGLKMAGPGLHTTAADWLAVRPQPASVADRTRIPGFGIALPGRAGVA